MIRVENPVLSHVEKYLSSNDSLRISDFVINKEEKKCPIVRCEIRSLGCEQDQVKSGNVYFKNDKFNELIFKTDVSKGYSEKFCIQCENVKESISIDNLEIKQQRECFQSLLEVNNSDSDFNFNYT